jgi:hypothetical protein
MNKVSNLQQFGKQQPFSLENPEIWKAMFPNAPPAAESLPFWIKTILEGSTNLSLRARFQAARLALELGERFEIVVCGLRAELIGRPDSALVAGAKIVQADTSVFGPGFPLKSQGRLYASLFPRTPRRGFDPKWSHANPLIGFLSGKPEDCWYDAAQDFFNWATVEVGNQVTAALHAALHQGTLGLAGCTVSAPFADPVIFPTARVDELYIDIGSNKAFWVNTDAPALVGLTIWRVASLPVDRSGGQSFEKADAPLVERMRGLIKNKDARSVTVAANMVASEAKTLGAQPDSVIRRLRARYARKYPTRPRR